MSAARSTHPVVYLVLIIPFGAMTGYVGVALGYLLAQAGVNAQHIAGLIAVYFLPQTWKFLWAPITDITLSRKSWYVLAAVLGALGFVAIGMTPADAKSLPWLGAVLFIASVATTFLAMSVESLMAYGTSEGEKGRAAGWFQAGNFCGYGLGGGAGLWMAQHLPQPWMAAATVGAACLACCAALAFVAEPPAAPRPATLLRSLGEVLRDLWDVARSRRGAFALLICFLPIGTGAATGLWAAISGDWGASANTVALVSGATGGAASAIGCLAGGYLCDRMDRKRAYLVFGLLQALCAVTMAAAPRTEPMYIAFVTIYWFTNGLAYAAFSAVVLEAMGLGAAATKYNLFASLSNMPIAYMTLVDGWAHTHGGAALMLYAEAAMGAAGIMVFMACAALAKSSRA